MSAAPHFPTHKLIGVIFCPPNVLKDDLWWCCWVKKCDNPPHKGQLYISLEAKKILKLDEIWWLVTPQNPLKINQPASYEDRLKNCKLIVKNQPIKVKEIEKKINSKYSYQTIKYLKKHYKNINFFWLMGADNLINFHKWQNSNRIINEISNYNSLD